MEQKLCADNVLSLLNQAVQDEQVRRVIKDACERYAMDTIGRDRDISQQIANLMTDAAPEATVIVPVLDGEAGKYLPAHCYVERRIVANLIAHMQRAGFSVRNVYDGEDVHQIRNGHAPEAIKKAMEHIFAVDESSLRFRKIEADHAKQWPAHGVLLIGGNGVDIISDWNYTDGDPDGFSTAMDAFDAEQFQ